jgi:hypothetical protein
MFGRLRRRLAVPKKSLAFLSPNIHAGGIIGFSDGKLCAAQKLRVDCGFNAKIEPVLKLRIYFLAAV